MEALWHSPQHFQLSHDNVEKHACQSPHPQPSPGLFTHLKRKRADSFDTTVSVSAASPTKRRKDDLPVAKLDADVSTTAPVKPVEPVVASTAPSAQQPAAVEPTSPVKPIVQRATSENANWTLRDKALEKVEAQINLEILFKHNELRLIEQELAKCQVALEQLRRCEVIPYPTEQGTVESRMLVTTGTGPALEPAAGLTRPSYPAPWGVTDGPYARHYARWLLPDPSFDPSIPETPRANYAMESRSSARGSIYDRPMFPSSRSQRYAQSAKFQSLPTAFAPPKDRNQPLILKRQNGEYVKLICKWCQKDNISSVQGFLNHCRIAHQHNYLSHEAAAQDCGHPLEGEEAPPATPAAQTPVVQTPTTATTVTTPAAAVLTGRPHVHPLITGPAKSGMSSAAQSLNTTPVRPFSKPKKSKSASVKSGKVVGSEAAPQLSNLLKKQGVTCDLKQAVSEAKVKCDIDQIPSLVQDDDVDDVRTKAQATIAARHAAVAQSSTGVSGVRMPQPVNANFNAATPPSFSASRNFGQRLTIPSFEGSSTTGSSFVFTPNLEPGSFMRSPETPDNMHDSPEDRMDLSPRTVDTNPGMVTDRDDDDEAESEPRYHGDHDMTVDNVRIREHHSGDHHSADDHDTDMTEPKPTPMFQQSSQQPQQSQSPQQPPKKKRGRPSKKDKAAQAAATTTAQQS